MRWVKIIGLITFFIGLIVLIVFVRKAENETILKKPEILIQVDGESAFLTKAELLLRLERGNLLPKGLSTEKLAPQKVELFIKKMSEVKSAKVYKNIGNEWKIDVVLRVPIARIFNTSNESYYLDKEGYKIGTSNFHTARVLVFNGAIPDRMNQENVTEIINNKSLKSIRKIDDVYRISHYVCNDPLLRSLIGQIHRKVNGDFVLIPEVGGQRIIFGTAYSDQEVREKFRKLKIFYMEAIPYEGWNKYEEISLKYDKQIVCKKKN